MGRVFSLSRIHNGRACAGDKCFSTQGAAEHGELIDFSDSQFPGPQLTLDYGDNVEVSIHWKLTWMSMLTSLQFVVHNFLPFDTSVHFHGIE